MNLEREAIAAYLAFGHWTSGDLQLPHRLGPNTAAAIERDMKHVSVRPSPIEYYPKPLEIGTREVHVGFNESNLSQDVPSISILAASHWTGAIRSLSSIAVASNAFAFDFATSSERTQSIRAQLAVAVLFAGDMSADTFIMNGSRIPEHERERIAALLLAVRIGVQFTD